MNTVELDGIGQIALTVSDIDKSVAFYRDTLGLKLLFTAPPQLAFFNCGTVRLMLSRPEKPDDEKATAAIYFRVMDLNSTVAGLKERGIVLVGEPHLVAKMPDHELWMAFLRDPDAHLIGLMHEKR
jgi:methylmalonyl-CoA/ethylmalonyl-CoA epimerase